MSILEKLNKLLDESRGFVSAEKTDFISKKMIELNQENEYAEVKLNYEELMAKAYSAWDNK